MLADQAISYMEEGRTLLVDKLNLLGQFSQLSIQFIDLLLQLLNLLLTGSQLIVGLLHFIQRLGTFFGCFSRGRRI